MDAFLAHSCPQVLAGYMLIVLWSAVPRLNEVENDPHSERNHEPAKWILDKRRSAREVTPITCARCGSDNADYDVDEPDKESSRKENPIEVEPRFH